MDKAIPPGRMSSAAKACGGGGVGDIGTARMDLMF